MAAVFFFIPVAAGFAEAGTISISSSIRQTLDDRGLGLTIKVSNSGDEAAKDVQVHVELQDATWSGPKWDILKTGEEKTHTVILDSLPAAPGAYPVFVTIDFSDLNMYPFTALDVVVIRTGQDTARPEIFAKAAPVQVGGKGRVRFTLKNLDSVAKRVRVTVFGPRELSFSTESLFLDLPADAELSESLRVSNFSAQPGAGYPLFLIYEYDQDGRHFTHSLRTRVTIGAGGLSLSSRKLIIGAGLALFIVAILAEAYRRASKKRRGGS